jgi:hypothetical protein
LNAFIGSLIVAVLTIAVQFTLARRSVLLEFSKERKDAYTSYLEACLVGVRHVKPVRDGEIVESDVEVPGRDYNHPHFPAKVGSISVSSNTVSSSLQLESFMSSSLFASKTSPASS